LSSSWSPTLPFYDFAIEFLRSDFQPVVRRNCCTNLSQYLVHERRATDPSLQLVLLSASFVSLHSSVFALIVDAHDVLKAALGTTVWFVEFSGQVRYSMARRRA
jgi:hypothetical protein